MRGARALRRGLVLATVAMAALRAVPAAAQTEADLTAARQLFSDALSDQNAHRYDAALDEFQRVAAVKDTANVRYRIATCLEALGRRAEALTNYEQAIKLGEAEKAAGAVVSAASAKAAELDRTVPRLAIVVPPDAPSGTEVRVDDSPIDRTALGDPLPLDPGHHTIAATAPGRTPFQTGVTLPEGGRMSITVTLEPLPSPATMTPTAAASAAPSPAPASVPVAPPDTTAGRTPTGAYVLLGAGGVLAVGSIVSLLLRQSNLNTLSNDCKTLASGSLSCPQARAGEVNDARHGAQIEGPLGLGLAGGAVVALGAGIWMIATSHPAAPSAGVRVAPVLTNTGGLLVVGGAL